MLKRKIKSRLYNIYKSKLSGSFRLSSFPYISGDTIRNQCNHIYDELKNFNPKKIATNDFIFVKADLLDNYFKEIHPRIKKKYNLISHNSDAAINKNFKRYLDEFIIKWFAQNIEEKFSEKLVFIPIGLENRWYFKNGRISHFKNISNKKNSKEFLIHSSFSVETHPERIKTYESLINNNLILFNNIKNIDNYLDILSKSFFNICPRGNGWDTHRIWESLIFNTIPVVKNDKFTTVLKDNNIPMLIVENWDELNSYTQSELIDIYSKIAERGDMSIFSSYEYWKNIIGFKN